MAGVGFVVNAPTLEADWEMSGLVDSLLTGLAIGREVAGAVDW